jgi:exonuclease III
MNFISKWATVNTLLNQSKVVILALQETHLDQDAVDQLRQSFGEKMEIIYSADPNSPRSTAGVVFVLNKKRIAIKEWMAHELIPRKALLLKLKWHETESTTLVNIYTPTHKPSHPTFWNNIRTKHTAKRLQIPDFMLGDFNVTEDPIDRAPNHPDNQAAMAALWDLHIVWDLQDAWQHLNPNSCSYTYRASANGQQIQSRIDRIYISKRLVPQTFDWEIKQSSVPTDHWMV